jgi:hypothetical protein
MSVSVGLTLVFDVLKYKEKLLNINADENYYFKGNYLDDLSDDSMSEIDEYQNESNGSSSESEKDQSEEENCSDQEENEQVDQQEYQLKQDESSVSPEMNQSVASRTNPNLPNLLGK